MTLLLDAVLEPNPPLRPRALIAVVGLVALLSGVSGALFVLHGAWPVTPFFGLDVLVLYWALRTNARAARRRERIVLTPEKLTIERIDAKGRRRSEDIDPYWLRVDHDDPDRLGRDLALVARGRRWIIGSFLAPDDRVSFAASLRAALREARTGLS